MANFKARPHFEDRQIVQNNDESIQLSGVTRIAPTILDFTGSTTGQTTVTVMGLTGYLNEGREYGFRVEPPLLKISGSTGYTTVDVTGYVLTAIDSDGNVGWQSVSGGTSGGTNTYVTGGTLNGSYQLTLGRNDGSSASPIDLSALSGSTYWTSGSSGNYSIKVINDSTTDATDDYAVAIGLNTLASGPASHAEGQSTTASGIESHAEGRNTIASGSQSHAEGSNTLASGPASHAEGVDTTASGTSSHAEGRISIASGNYSHAEGFDTTAGGQGSHAEGYLTIASGDFSHAEGYQTQATGTTSHAEGYGSKAFGYGSHAEGGTTPFEGGGAGGRAYGEGSHAEGVLTIASGLGSHAEGYGSIASGNYSHAEGRGTLAGGFYSHSQNIFTIAGGPYSHAGGFYSTASGDTSFIHSSNSTVLGNRSAVLGGQNITGTTDNTVYTPNLTVRGNYSLHSDSTLEVTDIPSSFEDTFKGSYTEFNWSGLTTQILSNNNPNGYTSFLLGNLSNYPTNQDYGFLSYFGSGYTRTGSPTTGTDFYRDKMVLKGSDDTDGMVFSLSNGPTGTMWWEIDGESKLILNGDNFGIGLNNDGTESPTNTLHVNGSFRLENGTEQSNYVLTSNSLGVGTWQPISGLTTGLTLSQVLTNGNETNGNNIVISGNDGLFDTGSTRYIWFRNHPTNSDLDKINIYASNGTNSTSIDLLKEGSMDISGGLGVSVNSVTFGSSALGYNDARYFDDYSSTYTNRSLVDKEYVDLKVSGYTLEQTLIAGNTTGSNWIEPNDNYGILSTGLSGTSRMIQYKGTDRILLNSTNGSNTSSLTLFTDGTANLSATDLTVGVRSMAVNGTGVFSGITYSTDLSSKFVNRSLVDKEYVDNAISGATPSLSEVLTVGNETLGNDIILGDDKIINATGSTNHSIFFSEGTINLWNDYSTDREGRLLLNSGPSLSYLFNRAYVGANYTEGKLAFSDSTTKLNVFDDSTSAEAFISQDLSGGYPTQTILATDVDGKVSQVYIEGNGYMNIYVDDNTNSTDISISPSSDLTVTTTNGKGIEYSNDYSATFTNRSLVDKEYVDGLITGTGNTLSQVLTNGNTTGGNNILISGTQGLYSENNINNGITFPNSGTTRVISTDGVTPFPINESYIDLVGANGSIFFEGTGIYEVNFPHSIFDGQIQVGSITGGTITSNTFNYDCDLGMTQKLDLQGATTGATITFSNQKEGSTYTLIVVQGSGTYDLTFPSGWWLNDTAPFDFTTLADNDRVMVTSTYLDSEWYFAVKQLTFV